MLNIAKLLTLSLIVCVAIMGLPSMASASTFSRFLKMVVHIPPLQEHL
jgi:hypothetical protein